MPSVRFKLQSEVGAEPELAALLRLFAEYYPDMVLPPAVKLIRPTSFKVHFTCLFLMRVLFHDSFCCPPDSAQIGIGSKRSRSSKPSAHFILLSTKPISLVMEPQKKVN